MRSNRPVALALALLISSSGDAVAQALHDTVESQPVAQAMSEAGVREAIIAYFRGGTEGDLAAFRRAFHPDAEIMFVAGGEFRSWTLDEYLGGWTAGQHVERDTRIVALDIAGTAASARVEAVYATHRFIDYLSLLEIEGQWRIVAKIFFRDEP